MHKLLTIIPVLLFITSAFPQQEKGYWGKADISYSDETNFRERDYNFKSEGILNTAAEALTKSYWFFISDVDGDNCPFRPSCSEFLQESVERTNIVQGSLMFFDRFTRDINFYNRHVHYAITPEGYFIDPPDNYIF